MSFIKKFEAYILKKDENIYKILNFDENENKLYDKKEIKTFDKNVTDKKIRIKKNTKKNTESIIKKIILFLSLNQNLKYVINRKNNSFTVQSYKFENMYNVGKYLFKNVKIINQWDLLKLKKIYSTFNDRQKEKFVKMQKMN